MIFIASVFILGWLFYFLWKFEKKPISIQWANITKFTTLSRAGKMYQDILQKFRRVKTGEDLSAEMIKWANETALSKKTQLYKRLPELAEEFTGWIKNLNPQELSDFSTHAAIFCSSINVELKWLFDPHTPSELKQTVEESLLLYCLAFTRMRGSEPFIHYKIWQDTPDKDKDNHFTQLLYARLVNEGLASAPADIMLAGEKQRKIFVLQSIEMAYEQNRKTFAAILKDLTTTIDDHPTDLDAPTQPIPPVAENSTQKTPPDGPAD